MHWRRREICFALGLLRSMLKQSSVTVAAALGAKVPLPMLLARLWPIASQAEAVMGDVPVTSMGRTLGHGPRVHAQTPQTFPSTASITDAGASAMPTIMPSIMQEVLLLIVNYSASGMHAVQSLLLSDSTTVRVFPIAVLFLLHVFFCRTDIYFVSSIYLPSPHYFSMPTRAREARVCCIVSLSLRCLRTENVMQCNCWLCAH